MLEAGKINKVKFNKENCLDVLKKAKEIISENEWVKHDYAVDKTGDSCHWSSEDACGFCLAGAIRKANFDLELGSTGAYLSVVNTINENFATVVADGITSFNDSVANEKEDIIKILDLTINNVIDNLPNEESEKN